MKNEELFYDLIVKKFNNKLNEEEKQQFDELLKVKKFQRIYYWCTHQNYSKPNQDFDYQTALMLLRKKLGQADQLQKEVMQLTGVKKELPKIGITSMLLRVAAVFILVLSIAGLTYHFTKPNAIILETLYSTVEGERDSVLLEDGSIVYLNAATKIAVAGDYNEENRQIELLEGEAFFSVEKNPDKPFYVKQQGLVTRVVGTSFNVLAAERKTIITVNTGKVQISHESLSGEFSLIKGEQVSFNQQSQTLTKGKVDVGQFISWKDGTLSFNKGYSFEAVLKKMESWYSVSIECNDQALLESTVYGSYHQKDIEFVLDDLSFLLEFRYEITEEDKVIIEPKH